MKRAAVAGVERVSCGCGAGDDSAAAVAAGDYDCAGRGVAAVEGGCGGGVVAGIRYDGMGLG